MDTFGFYLIDDAYGVSPRERCDGSTDALVGESVECGCEHPVEGVHQDLDRSLKTVQIVVLVGIRGLFHLLLDPVPLCHEVLEDPGKKSFPPFLGHEASSGRADYLPILAECGETDVLRYDQRRIHGFEVLHADPMVEPRSHAVNIPSFDLVRTGYPCSHHRYCYLVPVGSTDEQRVRKLGRT